MTDYKTTFSVYSRNFVNSTAMNPRATGYYAVDSNTASYIVPNFSLMDVIDKNIYKSYDWYNIRMRQIMLATTNSAKTGANLSLCVQVNSGLNVVNCYDISTRSSNPNVHFCSIDLFAGGNPNLNMCVFDNNENSYITITKNKTNTGSDLNISFRILRTNALFTTPLPFQIIFELVPILTRANPDAIIRLPFTNYKPTAYLNIFSNKIEQFYANYNPKVDSGYYTDTTNFCEFIIPNINWRNVLGNYMFDRYDKFNLTVKYFIASIGQTTVPNTTQLANTIQVKGINFVNNYNISTKCAEISQPIVSLDWTLLRSLYPVINQYNSNNTFTFTKCESSDLKIGIYNISDGALSDYVYPLFLLSFAISPIF